MGPRHSRPVFDRFEGIFSADLMARGHRKSRPPDPESRQFHLESARPKACRAAWRGSLRCAIAWSPGSTLSISMDCLVVSLQSGSTNYESNTTSVPQIVNQSRNCATGKSFDFTDRQSHKLRPADKGRLASIFAFSCPRIDGFPVQDWLGRHPEIPGFRSAPGAQRMPATYFRISENDYKKSTALARVQR
jgi:hypothetical protein